MSDHIADFRQAVLFVSDLTLDMLIARYQAERNVLTSWVEKTPTSLQAHVREAAELRNELCMVVDEIRRDRITIRDAVDDMFVPAIPEEM